MRTATQGRLALCVALVWALCGCSGDGEGEGEGGGVAGEPNAVPQGWQLEACPANANPPVVHEASEPGAGPAELGELDTDGNGLSDRDEWGPVAARPLDTDHDQIADYEDADDDGDGLLDIYDEGRRDALSFVAEEYFGLDRAVRRWGAYELDNVARAGERLFVEMRGVPCNGVAVFETGAGPVNQRIERHDLQHGFEVEVPAGATGAMWWAASGVSGGLATNVLELTIVPTGAPLLYAVEPSRASPGARVDLIVEAGEGASASFGTAQPVALAGGRATVPEGAGEQVWIEGAAGRSNVLGFRAVRELPVEVALDGGPFTTVGTDLVDAETPGRVAVGYRGSELVSAFTAGDAAIAGQAWVVADDVSVRIDHRTSAVAAVMMLSSSSRAVDVADHGALRALLDGLPEVAALEAAIAAHGSWTAAASDAALFAPWYAAVLAGEAAVTTALAEGHLRAPPQDEPLAGALAVPEIVTNPQDLESLRVEPIDGTGNVRVVNDMLYFVSVEVFDLDENRLVLPHAGHFLDRRLIGPQSGVLTGARSTDVDLEAPNYADARVNLLGGALGAPRPPLELRNLHVQLVLRSVAESIIKPMIVHVLGDKRDPTGRDTLVQILVNGLIGAAGDAYDTTTSSSGPGVLPSVVNALLRDLEAVGPITQGLAGHVRAQASKQLAGRLAQRLIPGVFQLKLALGFIDSAATVTDISRAVLDIIRGPAFVTADVSFGFSVTRVVPASIDIDVPIPREIELHGAGFFPVLDRGVHLPEITLMDRGAWPVQPLGDGLADYVVHDIALDGRRLTFEVPYAQLEHAIGPLDVVVEHDGEREVLEEAIQIETAFALESLEPAYSEQPSDTLTLHGRGFSLEPENVRVSLREQGNETSFPLWIEGAALRSLTEHQITLELPALPPTIVEWEVRVHQGPPGFERSSNPLIYALYSPPQGAWRFIAYTNWRADHPCHELPALDPTNFGIGPYILHSTGYVTTTHTGTAIDGYPNHLWPHPDGYAVSIAGGTWSGSGSRVTAQGCAGSEQCHVRSEADPDVWVPGSGAASSWQLELTFDATLQTLVGTESYVDGETGELVVTPVCGVRAGGGVWEESCHTACPVRHVPFASRSSQQAAPCLDSSGEVYTHEAAFAVETLLMCP